MKSSPDLIGLLFALAGRTISNSGASHTCNCRCSICSRLDSVIAAAKGVVAFARSIRVWIVWRSVNAEALAWLLFGSTKSWVFFKVAPAAATSPFHPATIVWHSGCFRESWYLALTTPSGASTSP